MPHPYPHAYGYYSLSLKSLLSEAMKHPLGYNRKLDRVLADLIVSELESKPELDPMNRPSDRKPLMT